MRILTSLRTRFNAKKNILLSQVEESFLRLFPGKKPSAETIAAYRKTIKIYDVFNFFNELEVLELRLNILDPYVDYFVILESPMTHSGAPKELYFEENKDRFKQFEHKIIHYIIKEPLVDFADAEARLSNPNLPPLEREILENALSSDSAPRGFPHFLRDFYEKESVKKALAAAAPRDEDFCFISDLDEIWNPDALVDYRRSVVYKFKQLAYYYYLNNRSSEPWVGTTAAQYGIIKRSCVNDMKSIAKTRHTFVQNGGWHFTYQGGAERVQKKIESFSHQEFNNENTKSKILERVKENKDVVGRKFKFWIDESELPQYLKNHREQYKNLFK